MTPTLRILKNKFSGGLRQLPYLLRSLSLVWTAAKAWTIAWSILLVIQGLLPVATVYLTRQLVNHLVTALGGGVSWDNIAPLLVLIALMGGILLLTQVLGSLLTWVRTVQSELVKDYIRALIHQKSTTIDFAFYESPDYYDRLHRACVDAHFRPVALLENSGSFLQNTITGVAMAAVLMRFGLWLPIALLVSTLPAFYVVLRYSSANHQWWMRTTADERRSWYYDWVLTAGETAAELRLFGLGDYFQSAYQGVRLKLRNERIQLAKQESLAQLGAGTVSLLVTGAALAWVFWQALQGWVTLGDLALFYQAFERGQGVMRSLLANLGQIYSNSLFLSNLFEFLALKPQLEEQRRWGDGEKPHSGLRKQLRPSKLQNSGLKKGICFKRVTFRYPGSDRAALENFNLTIPAGQIVAIVGANGAGKSTLIKLLCRLYDPQSGAVEWDGIDLRDFPLAELRRHITVLFQQPVHYSATAAENIALGDLEKLKTHSGLSPHSGLRTQDSGLSSDSGLRTQNPVRAGLPISGQQANNSDKPAPTNSGLRTQDSGLSSDSGLRTQDSGLSSDSGLIEAAAQAAGADEPISRLPQGYDTLLGKWFEGGMELSGGEWQRLALARAFLRQAPLIILDEPTSAMDSWAEADWLDRFRQLAAGRTAIIITHRFTIAKRADMIHVMANGQIVESGCHEELLALGCLYAQSWKTQMQNGA